jgi:hypothetical protein
MGELFSGVTTYLESLRRFVRDERGRAEMKFVVLIEQVGPTHLVCSQNSLRSTE